MSDNKFMAKLHGEKAVKSVLEIKKYGDDRPFANMPNGSSEANIGTDTQINHGISYVRGTQVWKIDGSSMSVADNDYTGSGADKTGEVEVSGQGLWVDATYVFPNNLTEDTLAAVISAHPKFVVNLFGDNLFNGSNTQIDLTVLLKLGNTNLVAKTFSVMPQANFFHKQLEIGFDESIDDDTYFEQGARLTLQVICSDPTATARIYTGMSNLVLLNRKIDTNLVSPDFQDFDEWVYRVEEMETKIDKVIVKSETIPDASTVDAGSVYMYMGETNPTYTHGYIYQNVITTGGEYRWERMDVQPGTKWGNITGDLADQEDLKDELDTINDRIDNVEARGRFLALWNATTGLPESTPQITPYTYKTGDYYIVGAVGAINYKPSGTEFVEGQPSTEIETEELTTDDVYYYDGAVWRLQVNHGKTVSFANLAGQPEDNTALKNALDGKQPVGNYAEKDKVNVFTAQQKIQSGDPDGAIIMGADAAANTLTNGTRKVSRIAMPLHEDVTKTMLLFGGDTIGDAGSTIGQTSTGTPINRIEFGGRLGAEVAAPDGIAFAVARTHNATDKTQKVYALEMNKSQARFNVRPNYNGVNLATVNDLSTKQDKLTAGQNITIVDNVISATGGGAGAVDSVNGKTGTVVLTGEDISADVGELTDTVQGHLQTLHDNIKDIELFKFPNATIIGEPIIDHGQVSGFSESNYLQFPFIVDLHNQPFVIDFCFTTGNDVTTQQNILDSQFGLALAIANGRGLMAISHNGTSWAGSVTGTIAIQPNTTYYARLSWNRILYKTELSTDGTTYTSDMTFGSTQSPYPRTMFIGGCSGSVIGHSAHPFGGTINMNYAYLTVAGNVIWQGMDDAGLATRADVSLGNLDEFGQAKFDAKQNKLVAGENITIDESTNTISATGDENAVHKTGDETIAGVKTFTGTVLCPTPATNSNDTTVATTAWVGTHRIIDFQIPTAGNGYTWYRKYADGWVEQGGRTTTNGTISSTNKRITIPVEMANTKYTVGVLENANSGNSTLTVGWESTTSFSLGSLTGFSTGEVCWIISGLSKQN